MTEKEKFKKKVKEITQGKKNVPGIYNYCDRWCERCPKTQVCSNFQLGEAMGWEGEKKDTDNEKFWEEMSLVFEATFDMLAESAREFGIDLDNLPDVELPEHIDSEVETIAKEYSVTVHRWLRKNDDTINEQALRTATIGEETLVAFTDSIEVIGWYSVFISAKVHRAHYELENRDDDLFDDNLGTAKIALIAITRSIEAFAFAYKHWPEKEDEILSFLSSLSKIKKMMLQKFPTAMEFKRPGFDD